MVKPYYSNLKISVAFILVIFIFILAGCRTSPEFAQQNYPGVIAYDGNLLVHFNLSEDSVILNKFISRYSTDDLSSIIDRTERLSVSIDSLGSDSNFFILAEGSYPKIITNLAIGREDNWLKHKDNYVWWENKIDGLFVSVPIRSVALISNSSLSRGLSSIEAGSRKYIPEDVKAEFDQAAVTLYSHLPGSKLYGSLNIPVGKMIVQELFFILKKDGYNYKISGVLEFLNESDAKIFSTVLKLGLLIKLRETGKISVMKIVHDSRIEVIKNSIIMDSIVLSSEEVFELIAGSSNNLQEK